MSDSEQWGRLAKAVLVKHALDDIGHRPHGPGGGQFTSNKGGLSSAQRSAFKRVGASMSKPVQNTHKAAFKQFMAPKTGLPSPATAFKAVGAKMKKPIQVRNTAKHAYETLGLRKPAQDVQGRKGKGSGGGQFTSGSGGGGGPKKGHSSKKAGKLTNLSPKDIEWAVENHGQAETSTHVIKPHPSGQGYSVTKKNSG